MRGKRGILSIFLLEHTAKEKKTGHKDATHIPPVATPATGNLIAGITTEDRWFSQLPLVAPRNQFTRPNILLWVPHVQAILIVGVKTGDRWFSQLPVVAPRNQFTGPNILFWVLHVQAIVIFGVKTGDRWFSQLPVDGV